MMNSESLLPKLEGVARRAAELEGVEVAWVELQCQGRSWVFRLFVECADRIVGLVDCERVGSRLGDLLDIEDPIESNYTLEVSTPGLDRPLHSEKDYERFVGRLATIKTKTPQQGRRRFTGRILSVEGGVVRFDEGGQECEIAMSLIEKGRLEVELSLPIPTGKARKRA
jgi:ribosome maturation factor RimP